MPKSKITTEQCEAAFEDVRASLADGENYHMNCQGDQYMVARVEGTGFKMIYKPMGPSSFIHCCEFAKCLLESQGVVAEPDEEEDEDDEEMSEEDEIAAEEEDEDEDEEEEEQAPKARKSAAR